MAEIGYQHIVCDPTKCIGCRLCEYACSATMTGTFDPSLARIRVVRIEPTTMTAIACRLCADAPCILACPRNALSRSQQDGTILVDTDKCDGCGWCVEACDFGAVVINPAVRKAELCNLCSDQPDGPRCIAFCPKEALTLSTP
ncbi:MAG: 4Fe-4S dicluster domain-containing protein, partial [Anaerolineae bacterium]